MRPTAVYNYGVCFSFVKFLSKLYIDNYLTDLALRGMGGVCWEKSLGYRLLLPPTGMTARTLARFDVLQFLPEGGKVGYKVCIDAVESVSV